MHSDPLAIKSCVVFFQVKDTRKINFHHNRPRLLSVNIKGISLFQKNGIFELISLRVIFWGENKIFALTILNMEGKFTKRKKSKYFRYYNST